MVDLGFDVCVCLCVCGQIVGKYYCGTIGQRFNFFYLSIIMSHEIQFFFSEIHLLLLPVVVGLSEMKELSSSDSVTED